VSDIRRALHDQSQKKLRTIPRRGYIFDLPVTKHGGPVTASDTPSRARFASGWPRWGLVAALGLVLGLAAIWWGLGDRAAETPATTAARSIAVLPFSDLSPDGDQEYFSDGIAEEILNVLARIDGLRVVSRTSSFAFKDKDVSIPDIARQLNVDHVLEGSVRKAGNAVRVTAQLVDVRTDSHLWSETYDRELEDIFAIQDEISGQIVQALKIALGADEQEAMAPPQKPTENLEAYEHYLRGRYFWQRRGADNLRHAIDLFERATALDPQFARAWSSLAAAHLTLPEYSGAKAAERHPLAVSTAHKALALDDSLAEAYAVLGVVALNDRKWAEAEAYFLLATASEPKNSTAHIWYSDYLQALGRTRDALKETLIAYQLDPLHPATNIALARIYWGLEDTDNALKYGGAAWDLGISRGLTIQVLANVRLGEYERASGFAEQLDDLLEFPVGIVELFVEASMDAAKIPLFVETLMQYENAMSMFVLLQCYVGLGEIDEAYRVANMTHPWNGLDVRLMWGRNMAEFHRDPRFTDFVTKLGLLDYWREKGWPDTCRLVGGSVVCE
jgi:TolB-like protein/Tfp pilus assembly protein PilF